MLKRRNNLNTPFLLAQKAQTPCCCSAFSTVSCPRLASSAEPLRIPLCYSSCVIVMGMKRSVDYSTLRINDGVSELSGSRCTVNLSRCSVVDVLGPWACFWDQIYFIHQNHLLRYLSMKRSFVALSIEI